MKKLVSAFFIILALISVTASAEQIIGTVLSTDIGTVIDGAACRTYNVDGRTFVIAEELRGYGFDVVYDDDMRMLMITQNPYAERTFLSKSEINIEKSDITVGLWQANMYQTDITVGLDGKQIEAYAIDGSMVIPVRALEPYAYVEYDDDQRLVTVKGLRHYLDERYLSGDENITRTIDEYEDKEIYIKYPMSGSAPPGVYDEYKSNPINVSEVLTVYGGDSAITYYWGNPVKVVLSGGRYYQTQSYDFENCTIYAADGSLLYDTNAIGKRNLSQTYIKTNHHIQTMDYTSRALYGYMLTHDRDYYNYWPSDEEINNPNLTYKKLAVTSGGASALADNGFLFLLDRDGGRKLVRYNVMDVSAEDVYTSFDGTVYSGSPNADCILDKVLYDADSEKPIKFSGLSRLDSQGRLYSRLSGSDELIAENVTDFDTGYWHGAYSILDHDGNLLFGNAYNKNFVKIASYVKSIYVYSGAPEIYFINESNELYRYTYNINDWVNGIYDTGIMLRLSDNIDRIINEGLFITTDALITDLSRVITEDVMDAVISRGYIYILKLDNRIEIIKQ